MNSSAPPSPGFLQSHETLLIIIASVVLAVILIGLLYLFARKMKSPYRSLSTTKSEKDDE
jgi:uncharacterized membrane protein YvbJ